jgi:FHA domain
MSACTQCGTAARPTDKFCNACGTPIARSSAPAAPAAAPTYPTPPPYAQPAPLPPLPPLAPLAPAPPGYAGAPGRGPLPRCQVGHEIAFGANYCPQGHPIALDQMQFASDGYPGAGAPLNPAFDIPIAAPYATPAPPPGHGYGMAPGPAPAFAPPAMQSAFGGPPPGAAPHATTDAAREPPPPRALRGFLVAFGSNPSGDFWPLTGGRLTIGRLGASDRVDIGLPDPTISSRHAAMHVDAASGVITVEDTGSTNGTFVNDEHIGFNGKRDLRDGDRVRFGAHTTIVKVLGRV